MDLFELDTDEKEDAELGFHRDGRPTVMSLANAIQVWSLLQARPPSIGEAALAFNVTPERAAEAVDFHPWMFTAWPTRPVADRTIEHEGE